MLNNLYTMEFELPALSTLLLLLLCFFYFSKKRISLLENKAYEVMLITSLISSFLDTIIHIVCATNTFEVVQSNYYVLLDILNKFVSTGFVLVFSMLCFYTLIISEDKYRKKPKKTINMFIILNVLFFFATWFCHIELIDAGLALNANGTLMNLAFAGVAIWLIGTLILTIKNFKKDKRYYAIFIILGVLLILYICAYLFKGLIIYDVAMTLFCYIMFFSIENPDMKIIDQLEIARTQADKANRAKTDFLSSMSHEIRTPLNAIVGFSECINQADTLEEAKENAKDIVGASKTLLEIVNGILDISKIEAGKIEIINNPYDANELFSSLAKLIRPKMDEKSLDFQVFIAPDLPKTLYGDHANLKKVVTNLLSNASKYTDKGLVKYEVNCINSKDVCKLVISVEDTGRGIKKDHVDKLFTKFQRLEEDRNTTIEGTGLGLAITKQLVELMGGQIIVHTVYGEGSKFTVVLNQRIEKVDLVQEEKKLRTTLDLRDERILLVDDNELNLKVATKLLERYNANKIECINNGFSCIEKITAGEVYDVILLDDMMPKMSGVETLHKLKEIPGFNIPVVALTANAITGMREKYIKEGFNDYLAKPIEKDQLIQVLNTVLEKAPTEKIDISITDVEEKIINSDIIPVVETIEELENTLKFRPIESLEDVEELEEVEYNEEYLRKNGVDMDNALSLLGDIEMYNDTLKDYLSEVDNKFNELKGYRENKDMKNYSILVHSMKSDAKYLGLMDFADIAYQHELKSKEDDIEFVNANFDELEIKLTKALNIVKEYAKNI